MARGLRGVPINNEPYLINRFEMSFDDGNPLQSGVGPNNDVTYLIQMTDRPKIKINDVKIDFLNTEDYVAGKYSFEPITFEILDVIGPSTAQKVQEWVRLHIEPLTGRMGYAAGYKKNIRLSALDPTLIGTQQWTLYHCQISNVDYGNNDMSSDEVQKIKVTIRFPYAELNY